MSQYRKPAQVKSDIAATGVSDRDKIRQLCMVGLRLVLKVPDLKVTIIKVLLENFPEYVVKK